MEKKWINKSFTTLPPSFSLTLRSTVKYSTAKIFFTVSYTVLSFQHFYIYINFLDPMASSMHFFCLWSKNDDFFLAMLCVAAFSSFLLMYSFIHWWEWAHCASQPVDLSCRMSFHFPHVNCTGDRFCCFTWGRCGLLGTNMKYINTFCQIPAILLCVLC